MVFEKIQGILAELLSIDPETITMDSLIIDNLGADSLDLVETIMTVEEEFGVKFEDEDIEGLKTIGDILEYISRKK